jgi:hypothetical protein
VRMERGMNTPVVGLEAGTARALARDVEVQRLQTAAEYGVSAYVLTPVIAFTTGSSGRLSALVYFEVPGRTPSPREDDYPDPRQRRSS